MDNNASKYPSIIIMDSCIIVKNVNIYIRKEMHCNEYTLHKQRHYVPGTNEMTSSFSTSMSRNRLFTRNHCYNKEMGYRYVEVSDDARNCHITTSMSHVENRGYELMRKFPLKLSLNAVRFHGGMAMKNFILNRSKTII